MHYKLFGRLLFGQILPFIGFCFVPLIDSKPSPFVDDDFDFDADYEMVEIFLIHWGSFYYFIYVDLCDE